MGSLPLWANTLVLAGVLLVATELGYRLRRIRRRRDGGGAAEASGIVVSAILGLLALLIGFTFSMSFERYDTRRDLVLAEANALGTVALRADLLDEGIAHDFRAALLRYEVIRQGFYDAGTDAALLARNHEATEEQQRALWSIATGVAKAEPQSRTIPMLLESLNEAFDLASARRAAFENHTPWAIVATLIVYTIIVAFVLSAVIGERRVHQIEISVLFLLISIVIGLVIDVDMPREGVVVISQAPMTQLHESLAGGSGP